jgi:hypothetical protein
VDNLRQYYIKLLERYTLREKEIIREKNEEIDLIKGQK